MTQTLPENKPPVRDWTWGLTIGLSIGIGLPIARDMATAIYPDSYWQQVGLSAVVAGFVGAIVALTVRVFKFRSKR